MKYIHIVQFHLLSGGGVGSVITDVCEAMAKLSSEVYVLSLFQKEDIDFRLEERWANKHNIHVKLMQKDNMSQFASLLALRKYIKELARKEECVLYLHLKWGVLAGIFSSIGVKNVKRIEVYHSGYLNYKIQAFISKPWLHHYIAVSKESKQQLIEWFGINENKITVIYNGVDIEWIKSIVGSSNHTDTNILKIISVGRLTYQKGLLDSIKGYVGFLSANNSLERKVEYTIIGTGELLEEARAEARDKIVFAGRISREDVFRELSNSDIVLMPSLWEGNSVFMLESLAVGKPLAVTDIPAFQEVLQFKSLAPNELCRKESFGFVFQKDNVKACQNVLEAIYIAKNELEKMAHYVGKLAEDYSTKKQAEEYIEIGEHI